MSKAHFRQTNKQAKVPKTTTTTKKPLRSCDRTLPENEFLSKSSDAPNELSLYSETHPVLEEEPRIFFKVNWF